MPVVPGAPLEPSESVPALSVVPPVYELLPLRLTTAEPEVGATVTLPPPLIAPANIWLIEPLEDDRPAVGQVAAETSGDV